MSMHERCATRILMIAADLSQGGGVNKVIVDLANLFVTRYRCCVTILNGAATRPPSHKLCESVSVIHNRPTRWGVVGVFAAICRRRAEAYDVVISFWTHENILSLLAFLASRRTRVIVCEHTSHFHASRAVAVARAIVYRVAGCLVVLNACDFDHYRSGARRVRLIHNPIVAPAAEAYRSGERERLILGVGHLIARKGFADLIKAFDAAALAELGWRLTLVGDGPLKRDLEVLIGRSRSPAAMTIASPTPSIAALYAKASLIGVPSKIDALPLVLSEAMAWGVIPVAYAADGPAEILRPFPEHLVEIGDVAGLTERIAAFAKGAHHDAALRNRLRASIVERFDPSVIAAKWVELIGEVAGVSLEPQATAGLRQPS